MQELSFITTFCLSFLIFLNGLLINLVLRRIVLLLIYPSLLNVERLVGFQVNIIFLLFARLIGRVYIWCFNCHFSVIRTVFLARLIRFQYGRNCDFGCAYLDNLLVFLLARWRTRVEAVSSCFLSFSRVWTLDILFLIRFMVVFLFLTIPLVRRFLSRYQGCYCLWRRWRSTRDDLFGITFLCVSFLNLVLYFLATLLYLFLLLFVRRLLFTRLCFLFLIFECSILTVYRQIVLGKITLITFDPLFLLALCTGLSILKVPCTLLSILSVLLF